MRRLLVAVVTLSSLVIGGVNFGYKISAAEILSDTHTSILPPAPHFFEAVDPELRSSERSCWWGCTVPPHPGPLPWGEGEPFAAGPKFECAWNDEFTPCLRGSA